MSYPAVPPPVPARPQVVTRAVWLMWVGAGLSVVNGVVGSLMAHSLVTKIITQTLDQLPAGEPRPQIPTELLTRVAAIGMVFGGLLYALVWLWMAWKNHSGRSWARVLSTVLLCLFGMSALSSVARISYVGFGFLIPSLLTFGVGLAAVIMIWRPEANLYYQAVKAQDALGKGQGYPPGAYGAYGYGGNGNAGDGGYGYGTPYGYGSPQSAHGYAPPSPPGDQPPPPDQPS